MPKKHFRLLLALLVAGTLLIAYQSKKGELRPLGFLGSPLQSLNNIIHKTGMSVSGLLKGITADYEEIKALEKELDRLRLESQRLKETEMENERLRGLLSLRERQPRYLSTAWVIARDTNPWSNIVIIDKGASDLIKKGMVVITPRGLAGKVHEVHDSYSSVVLIADARFRASVRLQASRAEGMFSGTGSTLGKLYFVRSGVIVKKGEIVITSGLDRFFPPGISIGYVSEVSGTDKLFQEISVAPFVQTKGLEEVIILSP